MSMTSHMVAAAVVGQRRVVDVPKPWQMGQQMSRQPTKSSEFADAALRDLQRRAAPLTFPLMPRLRETFPQIASASRAGDGQRPILTYQRIRDQRRQPRCDSPAKALEQRLILDRAGLERYF